MKGIKRFIRVDFENGNHYISAKDEFDGKDNKVKFRLNAIGILVISNGVSNFYPVGSYTFVTWE